MSLANLVQFARADLETVVMHPPTATGTGCVTGQTDDHIPHPTYRLTH